jgi:stage II sporulation protein D
VAEGLALGAQVLPLQGLRIQPTSEAAISLNGKRLRGTLEITRNKNATLLVVNYVQLEDYLRGVLSKEAPDYWPPEALKAIAIAARTYALYQRFTKTGVHYDVTGDVMSQEYGGKSAEKHATSQAVRATAGQILLSGYRELFPTYYHSTCGGMTENGRAMGTAYDIAPLKGQVRCELCQASPFYRWVRRVPKVDVAWALRKSRFKAVGAVRAMRVIRRTLSGRASEIAITGAERSVRLSGYDFRALFGFDQIRSPQFTIIEDGDAFLLDGRGWGHGVGLCQWGAAELARRGFSATEILAYYYPGVQVTEIRTLLTQPVTVIEGGS